MSGTLDEENRSVDTHESVKDWEAEVVNETTQNLYETEVDVVKKVAKKEWDKLRIDLSVAVPLSVVDWKAEEAKKADEAKKATEAQPTTTQATEAQPTTQQHKQQRLNQQQHKQQRLNQQQHKQQRLNQQQHKQQRLNQQQHKKQNLKLHYQNQMSENIMRCFLLCNDYLQNFNLYEQVQLLWHESRWKN